METSSSFFLEINPTTIPCAGSLFALVPLSRRSSHSLSPAVCPSPYRPAVPSGSFFTSVLNGETHPLTQHTYGRTPKCFHFPPPHLCPFIHIHTPRSRPPSDPSSTQLGSHAMLAIHGVHEVAQGHLVRRVPAARVGVVPIAAAVVERWFQVIHSSKRPSARCTPVGPDPPSLTHSLPHSQTNAHRQARLTDLSWPP